MTILYIDNEHCSSLEQLKEYFKIGANYDNPIVMELLDYGRAGDISNWLREKGESGLADSVDNISNDLGDSDYFSQLTAIITGERGATVKPEFQKCFHVEHVTVEKDDNGIIVCVQLRILSSVNESYELAVRTNLGTKGIAVNPYNFDEGSTANLKLKFRKRPNSTIDKIILLADDKKVDYEEGNLLAQDKIEFTIGDCCFKMIKIEHGSFNMGAGQDAHQVTFTKDYYIGETPVTQALWKAVTGKAPSLFKGENRPVQDVSREECKVFINKLNKKLRSQLGNLRFCMPTEAEWEFAARGGNNSKGYQYSGSDNIDDVAWNNRGQTNDVATKLPNELGLYDMSGNICEWCQDGCRGGCWKDGINKCRISYRHHYIYYSRYDYVGLRLAMSEEMKV